MAQEPIRFSGEEHFEQGREALYLRLADLTFMSQTIPGLQEIEEAGAKTLRCRVKPGFSFLTGSMRLVFEIFDEHPPERARMRVTGKGIGSSVSVETQMELVPEGEGTRLVWESEVRELTGLSKVISRGLIEGAAKKINEETWKGFRKALAGA